VSKRERANSASNRERVSSFGAAQARIGEDLKAYYDLPRELPHGMLVLAMQLQDQLGQPTAKRTAITSNSYQRGRRRYLKPEISGIDPWTGAIRSSSKGSCGN